VPVVGQKPRIDERSHELADGLVGLRRNFRKRERANGQCAFTEPVLVMGWNRKLAQRSR
jgi:hypothetical protein